MDEGNDINREEILRDFQGCTGIEDIAEAIGVLDSCDWDLVNAINSVIPQETQTLPSERERSRPVPGPPVGPRQTESSDHFRLPSNNSFLPKNVDAKAYDDLIAKAIRESAAESERPNLTRTNPLKKEVPSKKQLMSGRSASASTSSTSTSTTSTKNNVNRKVIDLTENMAGSDDSDIEDMTDSFPLEEEEEYFVPDVGKRPQKYLIADTTTDETVGAIQFAENFSLRYGSCHPMFLQGTLEEAVKEASSRPTKERKQLAIYLHHDGSVMANIFCQQILCSESIVSFLTMNFVVWGWDVTNESNRQLLLTAVGKNFGTPGVSTIRSFEVDRYPVIIIVSRNRSTTEISSVINSTVNVDELMGTLIQSVEVYKSQQHVEIREELEREEREEVKRQQDEAYQESLLADRAKEEAKKTAELLKQREEQARLDDIAKAEAQRAAVAKSLPEEPGKDCELAVCALKCRLPSGKALSRKFISTEQLKVLFDFLFTEGFSKEEYKFLTNYPKRDLTALDETTLVKDIFSPQDTFIVELR